jgi:hypothetical protein
VRDPEQYVAPVTVEAVALLRKETPEHPARMFDGQVFGRIVGRKTPRIHDLGTVRVNQSDALASTQTDRCGSTALNFLHDYSPVTSVWGVGAITGAGTLSVPRLAFSLWRRDERT